MLRCFFWNLCRKNLGQAIREAASALRVDVFVFCEVGPPSEQTLKLLNRIDAYHFTTGRIGERFHIFTRFPNQFVGVRSEADRFPDSGHPTSGPRAVSADGRPRPL